MARYLRKRVLTGILVILVSLIINFSLIHLAPGNPINLLAGKDNPSQEMIDTLTKKYGLDKPIYVQFIHYIKTLLKGDLGYSIMSNEPVGKLILEKVGPTLLLALTSIILALVIGTALGILAARKRGSKFDIVMNGLSYLFDSTPNFWLGLMLILIFASKLKVFPTAGMVDLRTQSEGIAKVIDILWHLVLPLTTVTLIQIPYYFRIARSSVIQTMSEDFITTFRAAGMKENRIFNKYVFKNAILPTVTVFGINLAYVISGVAIIEIVFAWPGMGRLMMTAISKRDYPLLMGIYLLLSVSIAVCMIVVDVVYAIIDPRIRYD
ncbi:ABC transporter permease [Paratissierella segnis]|jgi:peptide/nickel transport system permease protein|uniref:ABC transporter permease n=1 Tax=Paratissierella segnis TaxID=2763679 RepID=A0A926EUL5_9FIRM|nr:ABC transporter permease [Paratissierella segnis]MBC8586759.1 ABC transporter permease [Paratissierella segnis]